MRRRFTTPRTAVAVARRSRLPCSPPRPATPAPARRRLRAAACRRPRRQPRASAPPFHRSTPPAPSALAQSRQHPAAAAQNRRLPPGPRRSVRRIGSGRLATMLAARTSPCAEHTAILRSRRTRRDSGSGRPRQSLRRPRPRTPSPRSTTAPWAAWVAGNGGSWFAAGVEARKRMAAAGYDVTRADKWAGTRSRRRPCQHGCRPSKRAGELLRGFGTPATAACRRPRASRSSSASVRVRRTLIAYQSRMESWLQDTAFWAQISQYVSDWSDEVYGDVRAWAVPGASASERRARCVNHYLQHRIVLARAGPEAVATAVAGFLESASTPLANAAWQWGSAFGWTAVPVDQMKGYVSSQVHALRTFARTWSGSRRPVRLRVGTPQHGRTQPGRLRGADG